MIIIQINVVDAIMGKGKTNLVKQMINDEYKDGYSNKKYIFVTPFLKQIEDEENKTGIITECPNARFKQPKHLGKGKLDNLHRLIINNENIAMTHTLFTYATQQTYDLLRINEYIIIIDEVIQLVDTTALSVSDYDMLISTNTIKVNEYKEIIWLDDEYIGVFEYLKELCKRGTVVESVRKKAKINNKKKKKDEEFVQLLVWNLNPDIFKLHTNDIYILTYLFEGSYMYLYFLNHEIKYKKLTIKNNNLVPFSSYPDNDKNDKKNLKKLVNIYEGKLNNIGDYEYALSKSWFDERKNKILVTQLQKNIYNFFRNVHSCKSDEIIWTTFKDYKNKLKGKGYTNGFVQCAEKGSNEYGDKKYIAYCCNRFFHPDDITYFSKKNITVKDEVWALSEMIQFIWRSAIRNDQKIYLYIPSKRMRNMFKNWLNN